MKYQSLNAKKAALRRQGIQIWQNNLRDKWFSEDLLQKRSRVLKWTLCYGNGKNRLINSTSTIKY